jgi:hypothetical protein
MELGLQQKKRRHVQQKEPVAQRRIRTTVVPLYALQSITLNVLKVREVEGMWNNLQCRTRSRDLPNGNPASQSHGPFRIVVKFFPELLFW